MKQLTSAEFVEELQTAPEWQLIQGPGTGQLLLAVRNVPGGPAAYFLGPQPLDMEEPAERAFKAAVEDAIAMRSTHDDQSVTDEASGKENDAKSEA